MKLQWNKTDHKTYKAQGNFFWKIQLFDEIFELTSNRHEVMNFYSIASAKMVADLIENG